MEVYTNAIPTNTYELIIVTYDSKGTRIERKFYLEEKEEGEVDLIIADGTKPKRVRGEECMWVNRITSENHGSKSK